VYDLIGFVGATLVVARRSGRHEIGSYGSFRELFEIAGSATSQS